MFKADLHSLFVNNDVPAPQAGTFTARVMQVSVFENPVANAGSDQVIDMEIQPI